MRKKDFVWWYDKKEFITFASKLYDNIQKGITFLAPDDKKMDVKVYFSVLPLNCVLQECENLSKINTFYKNAEISCQDTVYIERTTGSNWYCDLVSNEWDKENCKVR